MMRNPDQLTVRVRDVGEPGYSRVQFAPGFPSDSLDYDERLELHCQFPMPNGLTCSRDAECVVDGQGRCDEHATADFDAALDAPGQCLDAEGGIL